MPECGYGQQRDAPFVIVCHVRISAEVLRDEYIKKRKNEGERENTKRASSDILYAGPPLPLRAPQPPRESCNPMSAPPHPQLR